MPFPSTRDSMFGGVTRSRVTPIASGAASPARRIESAATVPSRPLIRSNVPRGGSAVVSVPSTARIRSPMRSPARSAGPPVMTSVMTGGAPASSTPMPTAPAPDRVSISVSLPTGVRKNVWQSLRLAAICEMAAYRSFVASGACAASGTYAASNAAMSAARSPVNDGAASMRSPSAAASCRTPAHACDSRSDEFSGLMYWSISRTNAVWIIVTPPSRSSAGSGVGVPSGGVAVAAAAVTSAVGVSVGTPASRRPRRAPCRRCTPPRATPARPRSRPRQCVASDQGQQEESWGKSARGV